eukprot:TRINITY_DN13009_c0_g1_i1.p1 TRINITY_DN13009_c0_g1~~TRINITY_DN13009_c0_g1_i1.p1  ORF type:complete len:116 (+),score=4.98 TRINITY_DN13009_c0_g1_i1:66-413(+)
MCIRDRYNTESPKLDDQRSSIMSTIFCPSGVVLDEMNGKSIKEQDENKQLQRADWVQLILSQNNFTSLVQLSDEDYLRGYPRFNEKGNTFEDINNQNRLMEVWCKVHHVREITQY